jgi:hypothetical protein
MNIKKTLSTILSIALCLVMLNTQDVMAQVGLGDKVFFKITPHSVSGDISETFISDKNNEDEWNLWMRTTVPITGANLRAELLNGINLATSLQTTPNNIIIHPTISPASVFNNPELDIGWTNNGDEIEFPTYTRIGKFNFTNSGKVKFIDTDNLTFWGNKASGTNYDEFSIEGVDGNNEINVVTNQNPTISSVEIKNASGTWVQMQSGVTVPNIPTTNPQIRYIFDDPTDHYMVEAKFSGASGINKTVSGLQIPYLYVKTSYVTTFASSLQFSTTYSNLTFEVKDNQNAKGVLSNLSFSTISDNIPPNPLTKGYTTMIDESSTMPADGTVATIDFYQTTDNSGIMGEYYTWRADYLIDNGIINEVTGEILDAQALMTMVNNADYLSATEHVNGDTYNTATITKNKLYRAEVNGLNYDGFAESAIALIARDNSTSIFGIPTYNFTDAIIIQKPGDVMGYTDGSSVEWPDGRIKPFDAVKIYENVLKGDPVNVYSPYNY